MTSFLSNPSGSIWVRFNKVVIPATTEAVFQVSESETHGLHVKISIFNDAQDKYFNATIVIGKKNGTLRRSVYGRLGDNISKLITTDLSSGLISLQVTNNEIFDLTITGAYVRI